MSAGGGGHGDVGRDDVGGEAPPVKRPRHGLAASFGFALAGLIYFVRTQRNARIHLSVAALALSLSAWLGISRVEWAVIVLTVSCVLILEGINTAIEAVVDLASPQFHPLAKIAKDVSAGMVLVASLASMAVGLLILAPPLWARLAL
jgi:diacylglycerol kinase